MGNLHYILLGGGMLCLAFVLRRTFQRANGRSKRDRERDITERAAQSVAAQVKVKDRLRDLELRLYDFGREVEGRMETRLAVLDELISEADREIGELRIALHDEAGYANEVAAPRSGLTREQAHMADCLYGAGFQVQEIASAMKCHPKDVAACLSVDPPDASDAAA